MSRLTEKRAAGLTDMRRLVCACSVINFPLASMDLRSDTPSSIAREQKLL